MPEKLSTIKKAGIKPKVIVILGPTASGKSDLAVELAIKFNGEIISADSRQVYKGMDIGSGKITKEEMKSIPHYLLDAASPKRTFTASQFQKLGTSAIKKILNHGHVPIICGGTGFYIDSLIYKSDFPKVVPQVELRKKLEKLSTKELFGKLAQLDPGRSNVIDKNNRRRLIRSIEIATVLGKVPIIKMDDRKTDYDILKIGITRSKEDLEKLIKVRLEKRLKIGMVEEVKNLHSQGLSWKKLESFGLEYKFIAQYLQEKISEDEMKKFIVSESTKYSKRQMTWFKRDKEIKWILDPKEAFDICKKFL